MSYLHFIAMTERVKLWYCVKSYVVLKNSQAKTIRKLQKIFGDHFTRVSPVFGSGLIVPKVDKSWSKVNLEVKDRQPAVTKI